MDAGEEIAIRWARDAQDVQGAFAVRERVFCGEQGVPVADELDGRDDDALHLVALAPVSAPADVVPAGGVHVGDARVDAGAGAKVVGTLRLLLDGDRAKVGRVAVDRGWRRRGIASRMLELAVAGARERGCAQVRLAAQVAAIGLYANAGFTVDSDTFEEAGIPHVWMGLTLAEAR